MAIRIGHASIDENRKATGGTPGDQTGKEVCVRNWYNGGWAYVARAKDNAVAEKISATCEAACNNPNIGYCQGHRNSLMTQAKTVNYDLAKITTPCEADCSSLVSVCVRAAINRDFWAGNAPTTRTLKTALIATGAFEIITDSKYLKSSDYLKRGDILCNPGKHTVVVLDTGTKAATTSPETDTATEPTYAVMLPIIRKGDVSETVRAMQILLLGRGCDPGKAGFDGDFGSGTLVALKKFQAASGLTADGECGPKTWAALLGRG